MVLARIKSVGTKFRVVPDIPRWLATGYQSILELGRQLQSSLRVSLALLAKVGCRRWTKSPLGITNPPSDLMFREKSSMLLGNVLPLMHGIDVPIAGS
ncbi:hypothetical protein PoMZ_02087 [Pyricularia oryzae]|uniref:Uncharacterized protein n=1 Tax=Pyricularia oryzae TaxID=318829 RepID=A0A4P7N467_PYROR|nr:hypothetical protein PoMZ_02087 [Pyricularia oryzae]